MQIDFSETICLTNAQNTASYTSARQNRLGSHMHIYVGIPISTVDMGMVVPII